MTTVQQQFFKYTVAVYFRNRFAKSNFMYSIS